MSWMDWIPEAIGAYGLYKSKDKRKYPDMPDPIDPELLKAMMFQNSVSPWGNQTWSEGPDGQMTSTYSFTPEQEMLYERGLNRSMQPDQAYQMPGELSQLQKALMDKRLMQLGLTPDPSYGTQEVAQSGGPFSYSSQSAPTGEIADEETDYMPESRADDNTGPAWAQNNAGGMNSSDRGRFGQASQYGYLPGTGGTFSGGGGFNPNVVGGPMSGHTPSWLEEALVENAGTLGGTATAVTGIPGGMMLGNALSNNYWQDNAWNSSAMGGENLIGEQIPPRSTLNEMINDSLQPQQSDIPVDTDAAREAARQEWMRRFFDPWAFTKQPGFTGKK